MNSTSTQTTISTRLNTALSDTQHRMTEQFQALIEQLSREIDDFHLVAAVKHVLSAPGKCLRSLLVYLVGDMLGATQDQLNPPALAIELMHSYSLVHDDLPAMDDSPTRRGQPSCHVAFDPATAILVGDGLQSLAFETLATQAELIAILADASGFSGMVGGQALDISAERRFRPMLIEDLERLQQLKTGRLLCAATHMAIVTAIPDPEKHELLLPVLLTFSRYIGLAFQIRDDLLDIYGNADTLGKPTEQDQQRAKITYPGLRGVDGAEDKLQELQHYAMSLLRDLPYDTGLLEDLTAYIATRQQ